MDKSAQQLVPDRSSVKHIENKMITGVTCREGDASGVMEKTGRNDFAELMTAMTLKSFLERRWS